MTLPVVLHCKTTLPEAKNDISLREIRKCGAFLAGGSVTRPYWLGMLL